MERNTHETSNQEWSQYETSMVAMQELFHDLGRFIQRNIEVIPYWPVHIYHSALPFTPHGTALFRTYSRSDTRKRVVVRGVEMGWNALIGILRGHGGRVCAISFSRDDSRLASASNDETVRLWDGKTGAHIATLEGHSA